MEKKISAFAKSADVHNLSCVNISMALLFQKLLLSFDK